MMEQLSNWFTVIDQMAPSTQAFVAIAGATLIPCVVVLFVVLRVRQPAESRGK